ncbi:MAG: C-terminal binding protein, partial [Synergistaceae bacterium]|nr:C-terminal binding protein [Synergistaceae bacterium]
MERFWIVDDEWQDYDAETEYLRRTHPGCEILISSKAAQEELDSYGKTADALICQIDVPVGLELMEKLKGCKVISVYGIGYNNVDVASASKLGISVTNVPGYCAEDVADYVVAAIYRQNLKLSLYAANVRNGAWGAKAVKDIPRRICEQTLFVAGFGNIGRRLAQKAVGVGMSVLYYDSFESAEMDAAAKKIGAERVSLE